MEKLRRAKRQRLDLLTQAQQITRAASDEGRALAPSESNSIHSLTDQIGALDRQILELEDAIERERSGPATVVIDNGAGESPPSPRSGSRSFRSLFPREQLSCGPFRSHDDFWRSFIQRDRVADSRWLELSATQSTLVSEGGVSMPTTVAASVVDVALEESIVMSRASLVPMRSEKHRVWAFDGLSVSGAVLFGNVSAQWVPEGGTATATTLETKKIELTARKLFLLVEETREIVESGAGFSGELERTIGRAMAWHADDAFLHGDAIGKPQGALTSANPARIAVPRQGAGAIDATDVLAMAERMHPALFDQAIWITSNPCLDQLASLHIAGTNSDNFLFAPSRGEGMPNTLLGRPIVLSEKSPNLGTEADLALVNFAGYAVGMRQGVQIDSSMHVGFTRDVITLRGLMRTDGQSRWLTPFQPKDANSATLSWSVVLTDAA